MSKSSSKKRKPVLELAIAGAAAVFATWAVPALDRLSEPADYTSLVAGGWSWRMTKKPVQVLFLGNSLVKWGVDVGLFETMTGRRTDMLRAGASAGAWWYLVLDGLIAKAEPRPGLVVLCFSDDSLTLTSLLVGQQAIDRIEALLDEEDERVRDRVLESSHSRAFVFLDRHWPLVAARSAVRKRVEGTVKSYVASLAGREPEAVDASLDRVFDLEQKDASLLDPATSTPEVNLRLFDFQRMKDRSFLPDILAVADTSRIPIVFVRMPRRVTREREPGTPQEIALRRYIGELASYLEQRGFPLLDFSELEGIGEEHYAIGDHLNPQGRAIFTRVLVAALEEYLPSLRK